MGASPRSRRGAASYRCAAVACCRHVPGWGSAVTVVSVLNYKGGVGKTTVAANLGAELALRGQRVLLIDLDPQASLTLSFFTAEDLAPLFAESGSALHWFQAIMAEQRLEPLKDHIVTPPRVNELVREQGGRLDL